jgi:hypothetical protein
VKITKVKLEDELHSAFKSEVAKHGSNLQETIVKLITNYLKESKNN